MELKNIKQDIAISLGLRLKRIPEKLKVKLNY